MDWQQHEINAKLVGREVRKFFRGHGHFSGKLLSYDRARSLFRVMYADGDQEELELHEVKQILVQSSGASPAKRPRGRPRKHPLPAPVEHKDDHGELIQAELQNEGTRSVLKRQREDESESFSSKKRIIEDEEGEEEKNIVEDSMHEEKTPDQPVPRLRSRKTILEDDEQGKGGKASPHRRKASMVVYPLRRTPTPCKQRELKNSQSTQNSQSSQSSQQEKLEETKQDLNIPPLPSFSLSFNGVPVEFVPDLFSAFTFLRSFSWVVFLSPFTLRDFVTCLTITEANPLFDQIHLSLLLLLRQHLENLAKDGEEPAISCLKSRDWRLLDALTWPSYLYAYLLNDGFKLEGISKLLEAGLLRREYHSLKTGIKIRVLSFICDRLLDTEEVRTELEKRTEADPEAEVSEMKMPGSKPVPGETRDSERRTRARKGGSPSENSELVDPEQQQQQQQQLENVAVDWNTDDCVLCGMDGNLICCDGCPGAYHSRCVGVSRAALPEGDWFCPECVLQRSGADNSRHWKVLRGFELLGLDNFGRRFVSVCEHLFISETPELDSVQFCYAPGEVSSCLEALESAGALSSELRASILQHWKLPEAPDQRLPDTSCCMQNVAGTEAILKPENPSSLKKNGPEAGAWGVYSYVNHYSWGASAALAASRLAERSGNKKLCVQKAQIFEQTNAFSQAPAIFSWPSFKRKHTEAPKDRCGWCFSCKNLSRKKGCLLNTAAGKIAAGASIVGGGLRPTRKGWSNLPALLAYVLYMEDRLNGLLVGAWEDFEQRKRWRKLVESSQSVRQVRLAFAEFGLLLRPLALSRNWSSFAEDAPKLVPASTLPANGYVAPRGRRRKYFPEGEPITCVRWWRGGKSTRKFQDWEVLPASTLRRAARRGGGKRIPELVYSENHEVPRRTARCAWRARVESSSSVSELAIQVRYLDALIRWNDLQIPEEARGLMKESFIHERMVEGNSFRYLVESCKPENELAELLTPDVSLSAFKLLKALAGEEAGSECNARVWLLETQLPVCLVREFEEKRRIQIFEEKKRAQMLEEKRRIQLLEEQRRIQMLEERKKAQILEEKKRAQMLEEKKKAQLLEEKKRAQILEERKRAQLQMKAMNPPAPASKPTRKPVQADAPKPNKIKIILKKMKPEEEKLLTCEHCNLDLAASDSVSCEECQGDFHNHCMISRKKSGDPLCQSCFIVKQSRRSRKEDTKPGDQARASAVKPKPLQVYSRRRNQFPAPVNGFGGATIARRKRSGRLQNTGVKWKRESKLALERDKVLFPGELQQQQGGARAPECGICHRAYDSRLLYVGCQQCPEWYHGGALGIDETNVARVLRFKCHKCRKKGPPLCLLQEFACD